MRKVQDKSDVLNKLIDEYKHKNLTDIDMWKIYGYTESTKLIKLTIAGTEDVKYQQFKGVGIESLEVTDTVNFLDSEAFKDCKNLKRVSIYSPVIEIGQYCFENCSSLIDVVYFNKYSSYKLINISHRAFSGCTNLFRLALPAEINAIGKYAFKDCKNLRVVELYSLVNASKQQIENVTIMLNIIETDICVFYQGLCISKKNFIKVCKDNDYNGRKIDKILMAMEENLNIKGLTKLF